MMPNSFNPDRPRHENLIKGAATKQILGSTLQAFGDAVASTYGGYGGHLAYQGLAKGWKEIKRRM